MWTTGPAKPWGGSLIQDSQRLVDFGIPLGNLHPSLEGQGIGSTRCNSCRLSLRWHDDDERRNVLANIKDGASYTPRIERCGRWVAEQLRVDRGNARIMSIGRGPI